MRFLYIPRPICHENPLIFVATSLLLIQNGKAKKKKGGKKGRKIEETAQEKAQQRGKMQGRKEP